MKKIYLKLMIVIILLISFTNIYYADDCGINYEAIFENHGLVGLIIDAETGKIEHANKAAIEFYGHSEKELLNMKIQDINILSEEEVKQEIEAAYKEERNHFVFYHQVKNGDVKIVEVYSYPIQVEDKKILYSIIIDITAQKKLEQSLEESRKKILYLVLGLMISSFIILTLISISRERYKNLAIKDTLTGAYSRLYLNKVFEQSIVNTKDGKVIYSFIIMDLDGFKMINDNYGHDIGDEVLKKVVEIIKNTIRKMDFVVRYGGDEFLIILSECNVETSKRIIERISTKLKNLKKFEFEIEFSYGIEELHYKEDFYKVIKSADEKMYKLKMKHKKEKGCGKNKK